MELSKHFSLEELCQSETADRLGIDNTPKDKEVVDNLKALCKEVLQPLRNFARRAVVVNSGYRCPEVNKAVGGVALSQHLTGEAADLRLKSIEEGREWVAWIKANRNFDQLIIERNKKGAVWLHVSYKRKGRNRRQVF